MLIRLLGLIARAGGPVTVAGLARGLGVSEALAEPMIEELVRLGYLGAVEPGCAEGACAGCSQWQGCSAPAARLWALTEKGRLALAKG